MAKGWIGKPALSFGLLFLMGLAAQSCASTYYGGGAYPYYDYGPDDYYGFNGYYYEPYSSGWRYDNHWADRDDWFFRGHRPDYDDWTYRQHRRDLDDSAFRNHRADRRDWDHE